LPGKAHVSVNTPPIYVDIPAALQAVTPIENILPNEDTDSARETAALAERLYMAWKSEIGLDIAGHRACVVKGLYGRTAAKVFWDAETGWPRVEVIDQPRNLWLGWGQSDYRTLDWAAYTYLVTPEEAFSKFGLVAVEQTDASGQSYPYLMPYSLFGSWSDARRLMWSYGHIEVTDYWYRQPRRQAPTSGRLKPVKHDTWNAIIVGNRIVQNRRFPEYGGMIPYVPVFNSFIPGVPNGRPELFDIEQLIREKDERISSGSQLMHNIVNAQYWQLVGPDAPDAVPAGLRPKPNQVIAPGGGNRVERIEPWMPEFQLESFLSRIDREMVDVSGLNDLLRGMAPASVMSSSKAINALVANYETRISMKRDMYYQWRKDVWALAKQVWIAKDPSIGRMLANSGRLDVISPSLTPRDDAEAAQIAVNLMTNKVWSQARAMERTGVDDPEAEQNLIREERTDATMFPAEVQMLAQLLAGLRNMGYGQPPEAEAMAEQAASSMADVAQMTGETGGVPSMNGEGETPTLPPEAMPPGEDMAAAAGMMQQGGGAMPLQEPGSKFISQTQMQGGEMKGRILTQVPLGQAPTGPTGG
jgi:hypothetical protein